MYVAIDRMGQWCDASTMAVKTVGKEVDNSMTEEAQGMLHRNQAVKELHRNQAVKELHRNQAVKELHRNQAVKELHRNQAVKELIKPWIFYGRIVGTSAIRQPEVSNMANFCLELIDTSYGVVVVVDQVQNW